MSYCNLHRDCRVHFDVDRCPECKTVQAMECEHAETRGAHNYYKDEVDRLKQVERDLEKEKRTLQSRVWELEEQFSEELGDDLEDDPPIEEPQQADDMPARHGTEVTRRTWGKEVDRE